MYAATANIGLGTSYAHFPKVWTYNLRLKVGPRNTRSSKCLCSLILLILPFTLTGSISWCQMAFVTNGGSNNVSPINTANVPPTVGVAIPVGTEPVGIAVTPDGTEVIVTNRSLNPDGIPDTINFISTSTNTITATLTVQDGPSGVAITPNGQRAFVTNEFSSTVSVIDVPSRTVIDVDPSDPDVDAIALPGVANHAPVAVKSTLDSAKVYVANFGSSSISVIDTATFAVLNHFNIGTNPNSFAITPNGLKIYVPSFNTEEVHVLSAITGLPLPTSPINIGVIAGPPRINERPQSIEITPDGTRAYFTVDCKQGNKDDYWNVINTATDTLVPGMNVVLGRNTSPRGMSITPTGRSLYIALAASSRVLVVDIPSNTVGSILTPGLSPRQIAIVGSVFLPLPVVDSVTPGGGPSTGGTPITIAGNYFRIGATVLFGGTPASSVNVLSIDEISCIAPAGPPNQPVDVTVSNLGDGSGILSNGFFYDPPPIPTSADPSSGPELGGTLVTITGSFFFPGVTVSFGTSPALDVTLIGSDTITCLTPPGSGTVDITVQNTDFQSATISNGFTYYPAPQITMIDPVEGPEEGGTPVDVYGNNFRIGVSVFFGAVRSSSVTFVSSTTLTAAAPAGYGAGTVSVTVVNPDDQQAEIADAFTYIPAPEISSVDPSDGPEGGGTLLTVSGDHFSDPGALVLVGGRNALSINVVSPNEIQCLTPSGTGTVAVRVTNTDGQFDEVVGAFTYVPAPMLTDSAPSEGPEEGDTTVVINGSFFSLGAAVWFGPFEAASVLVESPTRISAVTAAGYGVVNVRVVNPDGQSDSLPGAFTYISPVMVSQVVPAEGPAEGDTPVEIIGAGFVSGVTVEFDSSPATSVNVESATLITCLTPAHPAGSVNVRVTLPNLSFGVLFDGYLYVPAPSITSIDPISGPASGGTSARILGSDFDTAGGLSVTFGGTPAADVVVDSTSQLTVVTPPGTGTVDVAVTNGDAQFDTLASAYTYVPAPNVSSIDPSTGPEVGGTPVTILGNGFQLGARVFFGGVLASGTIVQDSTTIMSSSPAGSGTVGISVTNPDGQSGNLPDSFTYVPAPTVTSVSPDHGPNPGGTAVTINGSDFRAPVIVRFGASLGIGQDVTDPSTITTTSPSGAGTVDIVVENEDGQSATLVSGYRYDPPPVIASLNPGSGPETGGNVVAVIGGQFVAGASVTFGSSPSSSVAFVGADRLEAKAPAGVGTVSVRVTNPDGQSSNLMDYVYNLPPSVVFSSPNSGPRTGGTFVTVQGSNFDNGALVLFGGFVIAPILRTAVELTAVTTMVPMGTGTVPVTVQNSDFQTALSPDSFTFIDTGANSPPDILPIGDRTFDLNEGTLLTFVVQVVEPDGDPVSMSVAGLPPYAAFDEISRQFSYMPPYNQAIQEDTFVIEFTASDGLLSDVESITLTIINTNGPPEISPIGNREVTVNKDLTFVVTAVDPDDEGQTLTYSVENLPVGGASSAEYDTETHIFHWSPLAGDVGTYSNVTFLVSDGLEEASRTITIKVNPNRAPVLSPIGNRTVTVNTNIVIVLSASDPDGPLPDVLEFFARDLPPDASFDPITRRFEWRPLLDGIYNVTFGAGDGLLEDVEIVRFDIRKAEISASIEEDSWKYLR